MDTIHVLYIYMNVRCIYMLILYVCFDEKRKVRLGPVCAQALFKWAMFVSRGHRPQGSTNESVHHLEQGKQLLLCALKIAAYMSGSYEKNTEEISPHLP